MVEWIDYKGQKFPFVFNYYAISRMKSLGTVDEAEAFNCLVYCSIEAGCEEMDMPFTIKKKDVDVPFSMKDAAFLIGHVTPGKINEIVQKFTTVNEAESSKKN